MVDLNPLRRTRSHSNVATALTFLFLGLGVGTLAALLLAPQTGKQMRKNLRRRYDDALDAAEDLGERASDMWDEKSEMVEAAVDAARKTVEPVIRRMRKA